MRASTTITIALLAGSLPCCGAHAGFAAQFVVDIAPGAASSYPLGFVWHNGQAYFGARESGAGVQLWATDGTTAGTRRVSDIGNGTMMEELDPGMPLIVSDGNLLYFAAYDSAHGTEPWISNGTTQGTHLLLETTPGNQDPYGYVTPAPGGVVYGVGPELWRSDGTVAGTTRFCSPATAGPNGVGFTIALNNRFWFGGADSVSGYELWTSDGTVPGTHLAADLYPGAGSGLTSPLTAVGDSVVFRAHPGNAMVSENLYAMRADSIAPFLLYQPEDVFSGRIMGDPVSNAHFALFPVQPETSSDFVMMMSDATATGTRRLLPGGLPLTVSRYEVRLATDDTYGYIGTADGNLWRTDGTDLGTIALTHFPADAQRRVKRIIPAGAFTLLGLATPTPDGDALEELWLTDGTDAGTQLILSRLAEQTNIDDAFWYLDATCVGGHVFFSWPDETRGVELYVINLPEPSGVAAFFAGAALVRRRR